MPVEHGYQWLKPAKNNWFFQNNFILEEELKTRLNKQKGRYPLDQVNIHTKKINEQDI